MRQVRVVFWTAAGLAAVATVTIAGLLVEGRLRRSESWPFSERTMRIVCVPLSAEVDAPRVEEAAAEAFPEYEVWLQDHGDEVTFLFLGAEQGTPDAARIGDWARARGISAGELGEGSAGQSAPDWFTHPRLEHDLLWLGGAGLLVGASWLTIGRRRRQPGPDSLRLGRA